VYDGLCPLTPGLLCNAQSSCSGNVAMRLRGSRSGYLAFDEVTDFTAGTAAVQRGTALLKRAPVHLPAWPPLLRDLHDRTVARIGPINARRVDGDARAVENDTRVRRQC
jgi:hypothetical protein